MGRGFLVGFGCLALAGGALWVTAPASVEPPAAPAPAHAAAAAPAEPAPTPTYSPFVLQMSSELPFSSISFKDVGMSVSADERALVYEEVAQSLAYALAADPDLPMSSEVLYSEAAADPASHTACGNAHIYVDVWAPAGHERWGYSLWSGCSEEDRFAWHEVDREAEDDIDALARGIASSLKHAVRTKCFVHRC